MGALPPVWVTPPPRRPAPAHRPAAAASIVSGGLISSTSASRPAGTAITPRRSSRSQAASASQGRPSASPRPRTSGNADRTTSSSSSARCGSACDSISSSTASAAAHESGLPRCVWVSIARSPCPAQARSISSGVAQAGRERQTTGQRLAAHQQVGPHVQRLAHPHRAGAPETGEHLVHHQQGAGPVAGLAQPGQEAGRRLDHAAAPLHRLDHDARDRCVQLRHDAVVLDPGRCQPRPERIAELRPAAGGKRPQPGSVVPPAEPDHDRPPGGQVRRLESQLDRAGPGQLEQHPGQPERRQPRQPLRQPGADVGRVQVAEPVQQQVGLAVDGGHHPRVAVADGGHAEAGAEVGVGAAVGVPDGGALGPLPDDGRFRPVAQRALVPAQRAPQLLPGGRARTGAHRIPARPRTTSRATYPAMLGFSFSRRSE